MYLNHIYLLWPVLSPLWCFTVWVFSSLSIFLFLCLSVFRFGGAGISFFVCFGWWKSRYVCLDECEAILDGNFIVGVGVCARTCARVCVCVCVCMLDLSNLAW